MALADGGSDTIAYAVGSVLVWGAILVGIAIGWLPRARSTPYTAGAAICLVGIAVLTGLSAIWASDPGSAFDEAVLALGYAGLVTLILVAAGFGSARAWLAGLAVGLVAIAVLALGARLEPSVFGHGERDLILDLPASEGRLSDPFLYWNALGAAMAAGVILLTWFASAASTRPRRALAAASLPLVILTLYLTGSRGGAAVAVLGLAVLIAAGTDRLRQVAALAAGALGGAALVVFTASRSDLVHHPLSETARDQVTGVELALVGVVALVGLVAYFADTRIGRLHDPAVRLERRHWLALGGVGAVALIAAVIAVDPAARWDEFKSPPDVPAAGEERELFARGGSSGRYQFWSTALDAFGEDPVKGVGAAGYEYYWNANGSLPMPGPNGHSLVLDNAAELGLLGVAGVVGFAAFVLVGGVRRVRELAGDERGPAAAALAVVVAGLAQAAVDWMWENPAAFGVVLVCAGLVLGPATSHPDPPAPVTGERRSRRRFAGGVLLLAFSWVAICASALLLLTNISLSSSRSAFGDGDLEAAADAANDAIDLQPWAAEPRQQLALVLEAQGDLAAARAEIAEAIENSPEDWRLWLVSARMALEDDDPDAARADAEHAQSLGPRLAPLDRPVEEILDGLL